MGADLRSLVNEAALHSVSRCFHELEDAEETIVQNMLHNREEQDPGRGAEGEEGAASAGEDEVHTSTTTEAQTERSAGAADPAGSALQPDMVAPAGTDMIGIATAPTSPAVLPVPLSSAAATGATPQR